MPTGRTNRRAVESDLVIYVNINLVPMDGGHKSVGVGLCGYESLKAHHTPKTIVDSNSYMDPKHSALHHSVNRIGEVCEQHMKVFHIETVLNNRMFSGPLDFLMKNEDEFTESDTLKFQASPSRGSSTAFPSRAMSTSSSPASPTSRRTT